MCISKGPGFSFLRSLLNIHTYREFPSHDLHYTSNTNVTKGINSTLLTQLMLLVICVYYIAIEMCTLMCVHKMHNNVANTAVFT